MQALSGLTPALSRRLQRHLLAHLPPRAAARLRRTLSLHAAPPAPSEPLENTAPEKLENIDIEKSDFNDEPVDSSASQFCTLPRVRRRRTLSREPDSPPPVSEFGQESHSKLDSSAKDSDSSKGESIRYAQERPLLSKYLAPERNLSLDETTYSSDGGSILSEPSYIAAYGSPAVINTPGSNFRRHSLRLSGDQSKKRISRFLRSDFFDTPSDESSYAKHKKEKEIETQKILKEIRDKKNKALETVTRSPIEVNDSQLASKDECSTRKCLSPMTNLILKDRSRSNTPFFPSLGNIKETNLDSSVVVKQTKDLKECNEAKHKVPNLDSKLSRPKSYPIKNIEKYDDTNKNVVTDSCRNDDNEIEDRKIGRESKLMRPKSYPTSSPSPEKVYLNRNNKKEDVKTSNETTNVLDGKTDVEVSFSITLPKKSKSLATKSDSQTELESTGSKLENKIGNDSLTLKKYKVINLKDKNEKSDISEVKVENCNDELKTIKNGTLRDDVKLMSPENQVNEKKPVIKKKIVKKVSSKSKTDLSISDVNESKNSGDKKKVIKKVKEKDKNVDDTNKTTTVPKKKSVLQSIGHKLEKFASSKSNSPEKVAYNSIPLNDKNNDSSKQNRNQREHSVPASVESISESNLIKRAVTISNVAALENSNQNKTTVSKVLGLFKKFEPKEKSTKSVIEKNCKENINTNKECIVKNENVANSIDSEEKPKRPNSLLLNGLGRKSRFNRSSSEDDSVTKVENNEQVLKKENDSKNTLKLDFSRLPRVKKIVPTNAVIEPQVINYSDVEKYVDKNDVLDKNKLLLDSDLKDYCDTLKRSRSRSRSIYSNSDIKSDTSIDVKNKHVGNDSTHHVSIRNHESISPEKEDIVDRIRRKSFYSRFNEKKQRRKSSLVGPGATEYDPLARIHSHATESKYDASPTSPGNYDLSPGLSVGSDISPSTERYRSLLSDLPINTRSNYRYDGINDKVDLYRSLDRKYSGTRSYLDYDQPSSYNSNRYSRTKSLFESTDPTEDQSYGLPRDTLKYSRTNSLFSPGSYATYRPKRTRNSAIILKESEKEPSPENILDKIRQKKISISVTRKPDPEKESVPRSNVTSKSEGDSSERTPKID